MQRAVREKTRGLPTGVFVIKASGRFAAKVGSRRLPGSYATAEAAAAARAAAKQKEKQDACE